MKLQLVFLCSLHFLLILANSMLWFGEGTAFPSGITIILAGTSLVMNDLLHRWSLRNWQTSLLGLVAAGVAMREFLSDNIESRLLAGAHFLTYLTWIVLFQRKTSRDYWWLGAFGLLQVAVGAVLTSSGVYGLLLLVYMLGMLWTMAVGNVYLRVREHQLAEADAIPEWPDPSAVVRRRTAEEAMRLRTFVQPLSQVPRNGQCLDVAGRWIGTRFVLNILRMAGLGVAVGFLVFLFVPRLWIGSGNPFMNSTLAATRAVSGNSNDVRLGHLGQILEDSSLVFRFRLVNNDTNQPITREEFANRLGVEEPVFRAGTLDLYEEGRWRLASQGQLAQALVTPQNNKGMVRQEYFIEGGQAPTTLAAIRPIHGAKSIVPNVSIRWDQRSRILHPRNENRPTQEYHVWSNPEDPKDLGSYAAEGRGMQNWRLQLLDVPKKLQGLTELAQQVVAAAPPQANLSGQRRTAEALVAYLRDSGLYTYSLEMRVVDPQADPIEDFLYGTKSGHCEYFASALALMLRSQKIPARLVTGYRGAELNTLTGIYEVQRRHAHAWVEAWIDDSWSTLDAVPYSRDEEVRRFRANRGFWSNAGDSISSIWSSYFASLSIDRQQKSLYDPLNDLWTAVGDRYKRFSELTTGKDSASSVGGKLSKETIPLVLGGLLGVMLLGKFLFQLVWIFNRGTASTNAGVAGLLKRLFGGWFGSSDLAGQVVRFYEEYSALLSRKGWHRVPSQTQEEFASQVTRSLNGRLASTGLDDFPREVTELFYRVRFGEQTLHESEVSRIEQRLADFRDALADPQPDKQLISPT